MGAAPRYVPSPGGAAGGCLGVIGPFLPAGVYTGAARPGRLTGRSVRARRSPRVRKAQWRPGGAVHEITSAWHSGAQDRDRRMGRRWRGQQGHRGTPARSSSSRGGAILAARSRPVKEQARAGRASNQQFTAQERRMRRLFIFVLFFAPARSSRKIVENCPIKYERS
jgi:hypothetical protein